MVLSPALAEDPAYAGAQACRACHSAQYERHSASDHARALYRAADHPLAPRFVLATPVVRSEGISLSLEQRGQELQAIATDGSGELAIPLQWAFGSGSRGVTFVGRQAKAGYLESSISFYSRTSSLDITPGHQRLAARSLLEAVGQQANSVRQCFQCHTTGPIVLGPQSVTVTESGVWCEACHGPARQHIQAAARKETSAAKRLIRRLGASSGDQLNQVCGSCHRPPVGGESVNDFAVAWNVRHQPPYLERSKCFVASAGKLSCSTCHSAHQKSRRGDTVHYRERCASCHERGSVAPRPSRVCLAQSNPDCVQCHMPVVTVSAQLTFRNHWIGVYLGNQVLIPAR